MLMTSSERTELVHSIWFLTEVSGIWGWMESAFPFLWLLLQPVKGCCGCARVDGLKEDLFWSALSLLFYLTFSTRLPWLHERVIVQRYMVVVAALDWVDNQFWFDFVLISFQFLYLSFNSKWKEKYLQIKRKLSTINFKNPPKFGFFLRKFSATIEMFRSRHHIVT